MLLLNGEARHCIEVSDRGLHYGDGVFETLDVLQGQALFLNQHLQRLQLGCQSLLIPCPDLSLLSAEIRQLCSGTDQAVLKLIITRGSGGRGYRQPETIKPTRLLSLHPHPNYPAELRRDGVQVRFCRKRLAINPDLAGIKHLNRLEQVLARAEWQDDSIHEGLMLDPDGFVVEGTMSNLFWVKDGTLHTPLLDRSGIAGIVRALVIDMAASHSIPVIEDRVTAEQLSTADELFLSNALIGIWPVRRLADRPFAVGGVTRRLQSLYTDLCLAELTHG